MKRKSRLIKLAKRLWNRVKKGKFILILVCIVVVMVLMILLVLKQRNIGAREAGIQIEQLADSIRNRYKSRPDYWGLSTTEVIKNKTYPDDMAVVNGILLGYFGNSVEVGMDFYGTPVMPTMRDFIITYRNLTKEQCSALASDRFRRSFWLGIKNVAIVTSNSVHYFGWDRRESGLPIDKNKANELCANGGSVSFKFE